uniref:Mitochondrial Carrier (MC) Family putative n=1 Tax=Albugo laibachii Nc14 TaxID=890382 RepID=F0WC73_9STRA|nr:Mitochondrial Carrier (MC) Family putative [Albugo laibachii Nc14]|eukprot:CCA18786.1 Mitochondrial Carrier (MC) Family putative [Albugo laibachii Nc14]
MMAQTTSPSFAAFVDASAGAMGALVAAILLYPLDIVKTRHQADRTYSESKLQAVSRKNGIVSMLYRIYKEEGLSGLYAGLNSKILHTMISNFAYFYWYSFLKHLTQKRWMKGKQITTSLRLLIATLAGAINMTMTLPLEVINTRAQLSTENDTSPKTKGILPLSSEIYHEDGLMAFWRGYVPALVLTSNPSINYTIFDQLKDTLQRWKQSNMTKHSQQATFTALEAFLLAAISKAIATIATYPIIRAKVLMQSEKQSTHDNTTHEKSTMIQTMKRIYDQQGLRGYYKGCSEQLLNTVLKSAFLIMTKEQIALITMQFLCAIGGFRGTKALK